jgi:hypothetical protein
MDGENDDDHCSKRQRQKSNNLRWNHDLQEQLLILYSNFKKDKNVEKGLKQAHWMEVARIMNEANQMNQFTHQNVKSQFSNIIKRYKDY